MYQILLNNYKGEPETFTCNNSLNLIFQLNYIKENRTDIKLIVIYQYNEQTKRLQETLVLDMAK